jgi:hypothetical protein
MVQTHRDASVPHIPPPPVHHRPSSDKSLLHIAASLSGSHSHKLPSAARAATADDGCGRAIASNRVATLFFSSPSLLDVPPPPPPRPCSSHHPLSTREHHRSQPLPPLLAVKAGAAFLSASCSRACSSSAFCKNLRQLSSALLPSFQSASPTNLHRFPCPPPHTPSYPPCNPFFAFPSALFSSAAACPAPYLHPSS